MTSTGMMRVTTECLSRRRVASAANNCSGATFNSSRRRFRRLFEFGEIIAVGFDQLADALDRVGLVSAALIPIGHLRRDQRLAAASLGVGGIQPLQGMSNPGAQFRQIAQLLLGQVDLPEQRIGKDLVQLGEEAILVGGGEVAQIEIIGLGQPKQDLGRDRALVALDQVDVAGGNAKAVGDLGLRQAQLLPYPPKARPDEQFLTRIRHFALGSFVTNITM